MKRRTQPQTQAEQERDEATGLTQAERDELRGVLEQERASVLARLRDHVDSAVEPEGVLPDDMDQATRDQDQGLLLRLADKERKLLFEIEHALRKFDDGTYGLCEGTDEPIGYRRLRARPWSRHSIEHQELREREKRQLGES